MKTTVDQCRRRNGAEPKAIDRLERDLSVIGGAAEAATQLRFRERCQLVGAAGLARFGATELDHVAARRMLVEVSVVGDHAVDLGTRQVQAAGDRRYDRSRHVAVLGLDRVQQWQQRAGPIAMRGDQRGERRIRWSVAGPAPARCIASVRSVSTRPVEERPLRREPLRSESIARGRRPIARIHR